MVEQHIYYGTRLLKSDRYVVFYLVPLCQGYHRKRLC